MSVFSNIKRLVSDGVGRGCDWVRENPKTAALLALDIVLIATPLPKSPMLKGIVRAAQVVKRLA